MGDLAGIGAIAKGLVDALKLTINPPPWVLPLAALVASIVLAILYRLAAGEILTAQSTSQAVLEGFGAALFAVGFTELHNTAREHTKEATRMDKLIDSIKAAAPRKDDEI